MRCRAMACGACWSSHRRWMTTCSAVLRKAGRSPCWTRAACGSRTCSTCPRSSPVVAVEGTLAQQCWAWPADLVTDSAQRLAAISAAQLVQRMHAWQKTQDGSAPDLEALRLWVRRQAALRGFWQAAAQRRDAVLLYVV
ncbi:hypothetical protein [Comamonas sp. JC664]|uniref:hypothetical protein n=1 Tax=Comamonas sp. JC664 TaxID=2801917 RepID=UPI00360F030F